MTERADEGAEEVESGPTPTVRPGRSNTTLGERLVTKLEASEIRVDHLSASERRLHEKVDALDLKVEAVVAGVAAHVDRAIAEHRADVSRAVAVSEELLRALVEDVRREVRADVILSKTHVDEVIHVQQLHGRAVADLAQAVERQAHQAHQRMTNIATGAADALTRALSPRDKELGELRRLTSELTDSVRKVTAKHDDIPDPQEITKVRVMPPIPTTVEARLAATVVAKHELEVDVARKDAAHKDKLKRRLVWVAVFLLQAAAVWAATKYLGAPAQRPKIEAAPR